MTAMLASAILLAGLIADVWSTSSAISVGGEEGNPILGRTRRDVAWRMTAFTALILLACWVANTWLWPRPSELPALAAVLGAGHFALGAWNARTYRRATGRWPWQ